MPTINDLRQQAAIIKNATQVGENTATRVGTTFETIADLLEGMGGVTNLSTIDIGSIDTLNTTGDMLVGTPNIYTLTKTIGANTFKVGTLFQFANNGRYDVSQVIVSQFVVDADGRIDTTSADQEVHIFYRLCKTMNGGSLPTPIGTWTTWTELGGSGGSGVTIDPYPTQNSGNAVSSGGVFERLQDVAPKVDISAIDDIDEYSDMLATKSPFYVVTKTLSGNVFRIGTLMEFANQGRYILYQILATDYVLNDDGTLDTTLSENGGLKLIWRMKQFSGNPPAGVTIGVWSTWSYLSGGGAQPDNEDIDLNADDQLQFANKAYDASAFSGLGRVYLRKNIVTSGGVDKNVLTQAMVNTANTIYHIQYDYDLNGQTITIPAGSVLKFDGGSVNNGTINATDLKIEAGSEKIFSSIQGSINTNSIIDCRWFGDNCSDINDIIALFGACHIMLRGDFVHDATIVVPYDVQIDAKDATINTAQDIPVIRLYAGIYDINLDGLVINVSTGYANNVVEVFGSSNPNISGYDLPSDYQPISINLPKVYGATQTSARDDNATAYYISSSNTGKNFYEHLYFAYIKGAAKNIHRAMRVDMSDGEFSSNVVNLKCWWCPIGLSSNIHFNDSCKVNILYQCNDYSAKLIQCDSNDYYSGGAAYNIDIWDEQHIATMGGFIENTLKGKYTTSFTGNFAKISLNKYFLYNISNTDNDNALTYNARNMQGLSSLNIDNQYLLRIIEREGAFGYANNQSCILNLVDYTNKNFLKTTTYTIVYGGGRFTPSSIIGLFQGLLKFDESGIFSTSRLGYIKVTCIVPNFISSYTTRFVSNVKVEIYEESTTQEARFFYEVVYTNTAQKAYIRMLNATLYNGVFSSATSIKGSTISNFNGGFVFNNTIYDIDVIGKNPSCRFTPNSFPSNDQEITVNVFGKTITFSVTGCSSVAEFVGKLAWGIDRNANSMHVTSITGTYLVIDSDIRFASSLTSYTIGGGGTTYATGTSGGSWGKENTYKINNSLHKGTTANRPTLASGDAGFTYWDTTLSKMIAWNGSAWVNLDGTALS